MLKYFFASCLAMLLAQAFPADAQEGDPREQHLMAIERMIGQKGEASLRSFAEAHLTNEFREATGEEALYQLLASIREQCAGFGGVMVNPTSDGLLMKLMLDGRSVSLSIATDASADHRISNLEVSDVEVKPELSPISWENIDDRLAEESWFNGSVLAVRDGAISHLGNYGMADRKRSIPLNDDTIYAMGSTPIDFTHIAILTLVDRKKLRFEDPISKFFSHAPADKAEITVRQLMKGESGLQNFHDRPSDANTDLSWIDRATALKRIFEGDLLFEPGTAREHSHSAWGLLAAIIEEVSGQSYGDYLETQLFKPLGMEHTGLYSVARNADPDRVAIGYSGHGVGKINSPAHWGKTSWLVMGSGGMVSTPMDMYRWMRGCASTQILSPEMRDQYYGRGGGMAIAGNERGFFTSYRLDPENFFVVCTNVHNEEDQMIGLTRALMGLFPQGDDD